MITAEMDASQIEIYDTYKNIFPFKIVEFINELGIKVIAAEMPSYVSGAIRKEEDKYVIYINDSHSITRQRFTLAHELGHFFNDKNYLESNEIIDPLKQSQHKILLRIDTLPIDPVMKEMDIKANQFAADILMPEEKFIEVWNKKTTPEEVAKFFKVSVEATKIRAFTLLGEIF